MTNVGFIGLGIMGRPMAQNLIAAGHTLFLQSRSGVPDELVAAGGTACADGKEVAERAEVADAVPSVAAQLLGGLAAGACHGGDPCRCPDRAGF